jgi:hypothetical protein
MIRLLGICAVLAGGCASVTPPPPAVIIHHPLLPKGASMIGTSTFATVLDAPPDAAAVAAERAARQALLNRRTWYGQEQGLSEEQARVAKAEQGRLMMEFATLRNRLLREQPDNFVGAMLRHEPRWAYVFFFKRDPEATLRHYTTQPKFEAELSRFSEADRKRLIEPWNKRWQAEGIPTGYGLDAVYPTMDVQLGISETDYRTLAAIRGWGAPPEPIRLKFSPKPARPPVDPRVRPLLRGFAHERFATLMQLEALGTGKLVLNDGCLRLEAAKGQGPTVVFHFETGIGLDDKGYLAVIDRMSGKVRARVGEMLAWGAPNAIPEKGMVGLELLRAACPGELINIGNPESLAIFRARYPQAGLPSSPPPPPPRD